MDWYQRVHSEGPPGEAREKRHRAASTDQTELVQLLQRTFTLDDQLEFARLSGDWNPMHVDPIKARRLMFGAPVVHGANLALWAMEELFSISAPRITSLTIQFIHPLRVGDSARLTLKNDTEISIVANERLICKIKAGLSDRVILTHEVPLLGHPSQLEPRVMGASGIESAHGSMPIRIDSTKASSQYPCLWKAARDLVLSLATASRLVGMECPGLNSIFSGLKVERRLSPDLPREHLVWSVGTFDERFSRVEIRAESSTIAMEIAAFLRPPQQEQPTSASLKDSVAPGLFSQRRAVVVGGSRGLGEVCSKLLAIGGADVCVTYNRGGSDADAVVADIVANGGKASARRYDVLAEMPDDLTAFAESWQPTHLYYFATPPIFVATRRFSPDLFDSFCQFYVRGFVEAIRRFRGPGPLSVFYPSTVAIDEVAPDMGEYSASKSAGEAVCRQLEASDKGLTIKVARLPRVPTDQTSTVFPTEPADPVPLVLELINEN